MMLTTKTGGAEAATADRPCVDCLEEPVDHGRHPWRPGSDLLVHGVPVGGDDAGHHVADAPLRHLPGAMALLLVAHHLDFRLVRRRGPDLACSSLGEARIRWGGDRFWGLRSRLSALSTVVFILAPGVGWLFVGRVLSGLAAGLVTGTATAALAETVGNSSPRRATRVATAANMGGLGLGPLVAGLFAQFGPNPTVLVFEVYLALLAVAALGLVVLPESLAVRQRLTLRFTGLGIPTVGRGEFISAGRGRFRCVRSSRPLLLAGAELPERRSPRTKPRRERCGGVRHVRLGGGGRRPPEPVRHPPCRAVRDSASSCRLSR